MQKPIKKEYQKLDPQVPASNEISTMRNKRGEIVFYQQTNYCTSFGMHASNEDNSIQPASFSTAAAIGFRLDSIIIFLDSSSTDLGNLHKSPKEKNRI